MANNYIRRQFSDTVSYTDQLSGGITSGSASFTLKDGSTFPNGSVGPFVVTMDPNTGSEEKVLCSSRTGSTVTVASSGRGFGGTSAVAHSGNASVIHTLCGQDLDEANQVVVATLGAIAAAGDLLVGSAANTLVKLAKGSNGQFLTSGSSTLGWTSFGSGGTTAIAGSGSDGTSLNPARYDHTHAGLGLTTYDPAAIAQQVLGTTATQTVTNKRVTKRVVTVTQSATPAINTDNTDVASITGLAQAITSMTTSLTGTPVDGDTLVIRITDNGTGRAITWGASFESSTVGLPNTTTANTMLVIGLLWNTATSKWRCVAVA